MDIRNKINSIGYSGIGLELIKNINLERTQSKIKSYVNYAIIKFGRENLKSAILLDDGSLPESTYITHIIEVGALKIIDDNNLIDIFKSELTYVLPWLVITLNCILADALESEKLYNEGLNYYFNRDSMEIITERLQRHVHSGMMHNAGFHDFSCRVEANNLFN